MNISSMSMSCVLLGGLSVTLTAASAQAATSATATRPLKATEPARKFEQAVDRAESLQLPLNRVILYREAAVALASTDKPRAVSLLRRALSDIDAAEASMKAQGTLDDRTFRQLEFGRLPVIMLMERIDPIEALNVLGPPQTADLDTAFQALFFSRLASRNIGLVNDAGMRKLGYGVTPAVVSAYEVLQKQAPEAARTLGAAIVTKLSKSDPADDPAAVQSAFALLRLLRTDIGSLAPEIVINPDLLSPEIVQDLFSFIGDAFLASDNPEMLILGERPSLYVAALQKYAPDKAQDVKLLSFAAPDAKSLILAPEKPVYDANHPDPATLTPEQAQERATMKARVEAQMKETDAETKVLAATIHQTALPRKERDEAVMAAVEQANKAISLARATPTSLDREAFNNGELELYNLGIVTNVVDNLSSILQEYATVHPEIAEAAARNLDGAEVQAEVELQIAIREMTGHPAYLVIVPKPPAPPSPAAAPRSGADHPAAR